MVLLYILMVMAVLVYGYIKLMPLFKLKVKKQADNSYSIIYDNKEIYNANPKKK